MIAKSIRLRDLFPILMGALSSVRDCVEQFKHWWLQEFIALFPPRVSQWLMGYDLVLLIAPRENQISLHIWNAAGDLPETKSVSRADWSPMLLYNFLRSHALDVRDITIGIQVPLENFFCRTFVLPREACGSVDSIVIQDLCRKTPFKLQDVYQTYVANVDKRTNRILFIQWVMRRVFVQQLINALGLDATPINFVEPERDLNVAGARPKVILQANPKNRRTWIRAATMSLCAGGILLALAVGGLRAAKQRATLDELEVELASIRPKAQQVRVIIDMLQRQQAALSRIRAKKRESAGLLEIWDNATRTLPSHTWLIELRLSERPNGDRTVAMTGFSAAAGSLVALLDAQPLFSDVELTAPIATDPTEGRERFALQAKLRNQRER